MENSFGRLEIDEIVLMICDLQTYQREKIFNYQTVETNAIKAVEVAKLLNIPIIVTEHHKEKYGETISQIKDQFPDDAFIFTKTSYSMITKEVHDCLHKLNKKKVILIGVDSHVCVTQTCYDLLTNGFTVHVLADAVSSQKEIDRLVGLKRMDKIGVFISTFEMFLFELVKDQSNEYLDKLYEIFKIESEGQYFKEL